MTLLLTLILLAPSAFDLAEVRSEGNPERRAELALDNANAAMDRAREFAKQGEFDKLHLSVIEVQHQQLFGAPTVQSTELHLMVEVRDAAQGDAMIAALEAADYVVRRG